MISSLWEEAIRSSLGFISAYLTPMDYGLNSLFLSDRAESEADIFRREIRLRIELGKARIVEALGPDVEAVLRPAFLHKVHYGQGSVEGALLVPRLIRERANNRKAIIPVLKSLRDPGTPEALLWSEAVRRSIRVCELWLGRGGAEAILARKLLTRLRLSESRPPLAELLSRPRPALSSLIGTVRSRTVSGWNRKGGPIDLLSNALQNESAAVAAMAGSIAFLASNDSRFEDRLFELICLGWLVSAFQSCLNDCVVHEANLRGASGPIAVGTYGSLTFRLYYQAGHLPGHASYRWKRTGKPLRAIPDFVIEIDSGESLRNLIVDAKNRSRSSASEIVYKMLGYKENLVIDPYWALGLAPAYSGLESVGVVRDQNRVNVMFIPLAKGREVVRRALRIALSSIPAL